MNIANDKFLRLSQVTEKTGLCRATIYNYIDDGKFPKQIKLGARCVAWLESEVNMWMSQCKKSSRSDLPESKK